MRSPSAPALSSRLQAHRHTPLAMVCLGITLYSTGPIFVQASAISGSAFAFWRLWFGVGVMGLAAVWTTRGGASRWRFGPAWRWTLAAGTAFGVHQLLFFSAVKATSVNDVMLITTLSPVVVTLVAVRLFGERPTAAFMAWGGVAILGAGMVALAGSQGPTGDPVGIAMAVANVVVFGLFFLASKGARTELDTVPFLAGVITVAAVIVSVGVVVLDEPLAAGRTDLGLAFAVAAGPGFFGHWAMTWPMRWLPANVPPMMKLAQPVLAGVLAWAILAEPITAAHLGGGALTLVGVGGALAGPGSGTRRAHPPPGPPEP